MTSNSIATLDAHAHKILRPMLFGLALASVGCDKGADPATVPPVSPTGTSTVMPPPPPPPPPGKRPVSLVQATLPGIQLSKRPLAIDKNGNPFVASTQSTVIGGLAKTVVKYWDGAAWSQLGDALNVATDRAAFGASIAVDADGKPWVAWQEDAQIYVKKWSGTAWVAVGGSLSVGVIRSQDPSIALDSTGKPYVAWAESLLGNTIDDVVVKRWTGSEWVEVGDGARKATATVNEVSLVVNASDQAVVAFIDRDDSNRYTYVKQQSAGGPWSPWGSPSTPMTAGGAPQSSVYPSLVIGTGQRPLVAWQERSAGGVTNIFVAQATASQMWTRLGAGFSTQDPANADVPSIAQDANGNPVVVYCEKNASSLLSTYAKQWNGTTWISLGGGALNTNVELTAYSPAVVVNKATNIASVAWREKVSFGNEFTIAYKEIDLVK
jgi:hypothetical protein